MNYPSSESHVKKPIGLAVASMVLGIVSIVLSLCIPFITVTTAIVGLALAGASIKRNLGGRGMAITGLVLSIIVLVISFIVIAIGTLISTLLPW